MLIKIGCCLLTCLFALSSFVVGQTSDVLVARANLAIQKGDFAAALRDLNLVLEKTPENEPALVARANCRFREFIAKNGGSLQPIKDDIGKALQINPHNALALAIRGIVRLQENDLGGAAADGDRAVQLDPTLPLGHLLRGFVKSSVRRADLTFDHQGGLEEIDKAYRLDPKDLWLKEKRFQAAKGLSSPLAKSIQEEMARDSTAASTISLEKAKQKRAANPWDFVSYDELADEFRKAGTDWQRVRSYWDDLITQNPNNVCAIRFRGEYYAGDWRNMTSYLESGLARYDGKNGSTCAAQIAFRIGREYNDRQQFVDADRFFQKAQAIEPDLDYLKDNITANLDSKAAADRFAEEMKRSQTEMAFAGRSIRNSSPSGAMANPFAKAKVMAAVAEYDRVHAGLERDMAELVSASRKYVSSGVYRQFYKGTYQRIGTIMGRMNSRVSALLKAHGTYLPQQLKDHLDEDLQKIAGLQVPPMY